MYDWLMNMASAAPQTLSMSSMALGGAEGGIDDPIWAQLFGDTVFCEFYQKYNSPATPTNTLEEMYYYSFTIDTTKND